MDRSLIDDIDHVFITLTVRAIHHGLSSRNTGKVRMLPVFGLRGGVKSTGNIRNINQAVDNSSTYGICSLNPDFTRPWPMFSMTG